MIRDCTTDITRTHHYGSPTEKEIVNFSSIEPNKYDFVHFPLPLCCRFLANFVSLTKKYNRIFNTNFVISYKNGF